MSPRQIADKAVKVCRHKGATKTEGESSGEETVGKDSVAFLAGLGADYLARCVLIGTSLFVVISVLPQVRESQRRLYLVSEILNSYLGPVSHEVILGSRVSIFFCLMYFFIGLFHMEDRVSRGTRVALP